MHPHFLFNALNSIAELIHDSPNAAEQMVNGLGDLLRILLAQTDACAERVHDRMLPEPKAHPPRREKTDRLSRVETDRHELRVPDPLRDARDLDVRDQVLICAHAEAFVDGDHARG